MRIIDVKQRAFTDAKEKGRENLVGFSPYGMNFDSLDEDDLRERSKNHDLFWSPA